jgi:phosphate transporter
MAGSSPVSLIEMATRAKSGRAEEMRPLTVGAGGKPKYTKLVDQTQAVLDENAEFFPVIKEEIEKINKFFVGKLAELRLNLDEITRKRRNSYLAHHTGTDSDLKNLRDIYVKLAALRSYCDLNQTGFYKIIKKYDKVMGETTLETWMPVVERQPFATSTEPLQLIEVVTGLVSRDKLLEWEMLATEEQMKVTDDIFPAVRWHGMFISLTVFLVSLFVPIVSPEDPAACRCMSILLLAVSLWITEAMPYFATALLIPVLVTTMGVLKDKSDPSKILSSEAAAQFVCSNIFNHTTWLLLGGYTISTAFSRCQLELRVAAVLQRGFGQKPLLFIYAIMLVGLFLSMWINNHTAPILCATILLPIVRDLPTESKFSKATLLGLAFACNFGGMMTPIASLQNALATSYLEQAGVPVSFGRWIAVALPFCLLCTTVAWLLIILIVKPYDVKSIPVIVYERGNVFDKRNTTVIALSLLTIGMFATSTLTANIFGDIAIISLSFVAIMFGSGMLTEVDFNSMSWHTLFLVGGGNVLGKAVESSGLLEYLADGITDALPLRQHWLALFCILLFCGCIATFISHTVAAIILMPIIARIGISLAIPEVVVVGSAFASKYDSVISTCM